MLIVVTSRSSRPTSRRPAGFTYITAPSGRAIAMKSSEVSTRAWKRTSSAFFSLIAATAWSVFRRTVHTARTIPTTSAAAGSSRPARVTRSRAAYTIVATATRPNPAETRSWENSNDGSVTRPPSGTQPETAIARVAIRESAASSVPGWYVPAVIR